MGVYLYPSGTETELKNAYIGYVREPNPTRTVLYRPLISDANDSSGNSNNGTVNGTVSFSSTGATFNGSGQISSTISSMPTEFTINVQIKKISNSSAEQVIFAKWGNISGTEQQKRFGMLVDGSNNLKVYQCLTNSSHQWVTVAALNTTDIYLITYTKDSSNNIKVYLNGVLKNSFTFPSWGTASNYLGIGGRTSSSTNFYGTLKNFILENKVWSLTDIQSYYNSLS